MTYDVSFTELDLMTLIDLKGDPADVKAWCGDHLPPFPTQPRTVSRSDELELMWLGPNHWILRAPLASEAALVATLTPEQAPDDTSFVRISDTLTFFELSGPDLSEVLSVASPLNFDPLLFPEDGAAFGEAFGIKALFVHAGSNLQVGVERSFGPMIADYLARAIGPRV